MGSIDGVVFRVGIARSCIAMGSGRGLFDPADFVPLGDVPGLTYEFIAEAGPEITAVQAARYDAIFALQPVVTAMTFASDTRLQLLALSGAGFDTVDIAACDRSGILVTNTPNAVAKPVALAILTMILALSHKLMIKDRLTRTGRWHDRIDFMGADLTGRVVGSIGFGNIAREAFRLLRPFEMVMIAASPRTDPAVAAAEGVRLVDFDSLLREADFLCVNCPLTPETHHLVDARALSLMKPNAYLINTSRGPIVDEQALYAALVEGRLAGAGLDVFEQEPTPIDNPLLSLPNVIATPHSLCWTGDCFRRIADTAIDSIVAVARSGIPKYLINPGVLTHPRWYRPPLQGDECD
jgi:phosphoglycerate dehydrogenase-like enzyme